MSAVLFLAHRLPFPPNKGDKIRSFHLLEALRSRHDVYAGTFVDSAEDAQHVDELRRRCADCFVAALRPSVRRLTAARAFVTGGSLTRAYYAHAGLGRWVRRVVAQHHPVAVVAFSSSMAQFIPAQVPAAGRREPTRSR